MKTGRIPASTLRRTWCDLLILLSAAAAVSAQPLAYVGSGGAGALARDISL